MGLFEERKRRKEAEAKQSAEHEARLRLKAATVALSSLGVPPRPYEEIGLVWSAESDSERDALFTLQLNAADLGATAVYGLTVYPHTTGKVSGGWGSTSVYGEVTTRWRAYGTALRWTP
ncbi:hypothetical protein GCM10027589_11930 [Actinocorallia lasiicapitis]